MSQNFQKYIYESFAKLVEQYGFRKENELNDDQSYSIEYCSNTFVLKLEKYRRDFYATVYKTGYQDKEINLFNLLIYLNQNTKNIPQFDYFQEGINIEEYYREQFSYISTTLYKNFEEINDFFSSGDYESKFNDINKFMIDRYPNLFKKWT